MRISQLHRLHVPGVLSKKACGSGGKCEAKINFYEICTLLDANVLLNSVLCLIINIYRELRNLLTSGIGKCLPPVLPRPSRLPRLPTLKEAALNVDKILMYEVPREPEPYIKARLDCHTP